MRLPKYNQRHEIKVIIHQYETSQDSVLVSASVTQNKNGRSCQGKSTCVKAKTIVIQNKQITVKWEESSASQGKHPDVETTQTVTFYIKFVICTDSKMERIVCFMWHQYRTSG